VLHAAAATRGGVTVVLPADQECGKSTTVAGLLREGYEYVTDEAVAIDPESSRVAPFPKTLTLDPGSWSLFPECRPGWTSEASPQWHVPAEWLGADRTTRAVPPPRLLVFPKYVAGSSTMSSPLSPAEAVREMARSTFEFRRHAERNLRTLAGVASRATSVRLRIGSLEEAVLTIEALVSQALLEDL
jgi:hypothetical protein